MYKLKNYLWTLNASQYLEEKRDEYRRHCLLDENSVDDDNDGGIGAGGAPVAPWCQVPVAIAEVDEPLRFLDDFVIWCIFWRF